MRARRARRGGADADGRRLRAALPAFVAWLPGALAVNALGTAAGIRLPQREFRLVTLGVVLVAGAIAVATAA